MQYSDVFATALEVRLMEAVLLRRLGQNAKAERCARSAARRLHGYAQKMGDDARRFIEASPAHRALAAGRLDAPPGWYWPRDI
jgi:hypothetical protein